MLHLPAVTHIGPHQLKKALFCLSLGMSLTCSLLSTYIQYSLQPTKNSLLLCHTICQYVLGKPAHNSYMVQNHNRTLPCFELWKRKKNQTISCYPAVQQIRPTYRVTHTVRNKRTNNNGKKFIDLQVSKQTKLKNAFVLVVVQWVVGIPFVLFTLSIAIRIYVQCSYYTCTYLITTTYVYLALVEISWVYRTYPTQFTVGKYVQLCIYFYVYLNISLVVKIYSTFMPTQWPFI